MKKKLEPQTSLAPVPAVMVSCGTIQQANIMTIAWTGVINSNPPLVYISVRPTRHSYEIIKETKEFVINLPTKELVWEVDYCGTKSGKQVDKFKETGLTKEEAEKVNAPMILECPVNLECKVKEVKELGSHTMFIAEIVQVHVDEQFIQENGNIDFVKCNLLTYLGQSYSMCEKQVAPRGICLKSSSNQRK